MASRIQLKVMGDVAQRLGNTFNNAKMTKRAVESAELMEAEYITTTMKMLNRSGRATGDLARNWKGTVFEAAQNGVVRFGVVNRLPYAKIHDKGGIIKAKKKFLAIPLTREAKLVGWPRDWTPQEDLDFITANGHHFLVEDPPTSRRQRRARQRANKKRLKAKPPRKTRKRKKPTTRPPALDRGGLGPEFHYLLKTQVKMPRTNYLRYAKKAALSSINREGVWEDF